jgi:large subunit ribosomal protein L15
MKLHDLHPAAGSRKARTRVGRGIAAGKGKTAGRGTKGQKARAGGTIPAWFEGGQTPLSRRIPKLRGFKNRFGTTYEVVNLGDIARAVAAGKFEPGDMPTAPKGKSTAPITVNAEILREAGLVRRADRPLKVLGGGADVSTPLFVVADAFSKSARTKIEAAGGSVSVLEVPKETRPALGVAGGTPAETPKAQDAPKAVRARAPKAAPDAASGAAEHSAADSSVEAATETESGSPDA